jgi:alkylation response protein AidB-like acyl-CoA dehydrogenase
MASSNPAATLPPAVEAARGIAGLAAEHAADGERERRLAREVVEAMVDAGFFRLCVPASIGGGEADAATLIQVCEELARGDAAAGWCIAVQSTAGMVGAYIPADSAREIYGGPRSVAGGVFAPRGRAVAHDDHFVVSGRWPFSSGVDHCDWVLGGCVVEENGSPRMLEGGRPDVQLALFPKSDVEVIDTWHVSGLRATGSKDIAVDGLAVPRERAASIITQKPLEPGPLYAFPVFGLLALTIAGTALGIARAAVDDLIALAGDKTPTGSARSLAERPVTQARIAQAEAGLLAARAFLYEAVAAAWDAAAGGAEVSIENRAALRLAASHATAASAATVDAAYELGGGTSIYETSPLQRRFRDVHAATQHMLVGPSTWELTGRLMLGLPTDVAQL